MSRSLPNEPFMVAHRGILDAESGLMVVTFDLYRSRRRIQVRRVTPGAGEDFWGECLADLEPAEFLGHASMAVFAPHDPEFDK